MKRLLEAAWTEVKRDPEIRCVIVTGAGERHFCTGADVDRVASTGHVAAGNGPMSDEIRVSPHQNRVWKPVIAAVNGLVNGGGLHLVVDADIIVAAEHAEFMDTHTSVGMVGAVENIGLAKRLPLGQALRMTLQGRNYRLSARRAYELGMVDEVVPGRRNSCPPPNRSPVTSPPTRRKRSRCPSRRSGGRWKRDTATRRSTAGRCCACTGPIPTAPKVRAHWPKSVHPTGRHDRAVTRPTITAERPHSMRSHAKAVVAESDSVPVCTSVGSLTMLTPTADGLLPSMAILCWARRDSDYPAIIEDGGRTWTWRMLANAAAQTARALDGTASRPGGLQCAQRRGVRRHHDGHLAGGCRPGAGVASTTPCRAGAGARQHRPGTHDRHRRPRISKPT